MRNPWACRGGSRYAKYGKRVIPIAAKGKYRKWLTDDGKMLLKAWARDGLSDEQLCKKMDISVSTFYEWKKKYPELSEALSRGKEIADVEVENALYKTALGYTETVQKSFKLHHVDYDAQGKKIREYDYLQTGIEQVHVPANVKAQQVWLYNRKPETWRERVDAPPIRQPNDLLQSLYDLERGAQP